MIGHLFNFLFGRAPAVLEVDPRYFSVASPRAYGQSAGGRDFSTAPPARGYGAVALGRGYSSVAVANDFSQEA